MSVLRFLFTALLTLSAFLPCDDGPTFEERLAELAEELEAARVEAHVPGMSVAIVRGDEVVFARGFGLADVEAGRPADAETLYPVGSTTKAFTAALVGTLVDEGKLDWDDPVAEHLPYFELDVRSDEEDARCTLRDLLSHRHGFTRMGILWMNGGGVTREEILRTAAGAEPWGGFREAFHYCNVTYVAAGEAAAAAAGRSWEELLGERFLEPLGMEASTLSAAEAREDPRLAVGYEWIEASGETRPMPFVELDAIGPAGSLNSNVLDMAQWVRLLLAQGELDGERLVSTESLRECGTAQIEIDGGVAYGMGWMLRERDGRELIEHGGNIGGFSAQVALMPEEDLGYVLLTNLGMTPLQQESIGLVFDALVGDRPEAAAGAEDGEIDYEDYAGVYVANFATFRGEELEVLVKDGELALDIPSQMTFDLLDPDESGRWAFALTDQIAVTFERDAEGEVARLVLHQAGFAFDVPRKGVATEPEVPLEELEPYVGSYVREEGEQRVKILLVEGRLAFDNGTVLLPLETPDGEGRAPLRSRADFGATFELDAEGRVVSLTFRGGDGEATFAREADVPAAELPTLDEILELRGTQARVAAFERAGGTKLAGEVRMPNAGLRGEVTLYVRGGEHFATHLDFGKFGRIDIVAASGEVTYYDSLRGRRTLEGDERELTLLEHPYSVEGDWRRYFDAIEVLRNDTFDGQPVHVLRLSTGDLPASTYWVDAGSGDVLRVDQIVREGPMRIPVTTRYSAFEDFEGIRRPTRVESENPMSGRTVLVFDEIEWGLELGDEVFTLAKEEGASR